jgi:hypothetical protein
MLQTDLPVPVLPLLPIEIRHCDHHCQRAQGNQSDQHKHRHTDHCKQYLLVIEQCSPYTGDQSQHQNPSVLHIRVFHESDKILPKRFRLIFRTL